MWWDRQSTSAGFRCSPTGTRVVVTAATRTASGFTMTACAGESSAASTTTASANAAATDGWSGYLLPKSQRAQRVQLVRREWSSASDTAPPQRQRANAREEHCHRQKAPPADSGRGRCRTRACAPLSGQVASLLRTRAGSIAAHVIDAEAGRTLRRGNARAALGNRRVGRCGGWGVGRRRSVGGSRRGRRGVGCGRGVRRRGGRCDSRCECRTAIGTGNAGVATESGNDGVTHKPGPRTTTVTTHASLEKLATDAAGGALIRAEGIARRRVHNDATGVLTRERTGIMANAAVRLRLGGSPKRQERQK